MIEVVIKYCPREMALTDAGIAEYINRKYAGVAPPDFMVGLIPRDDPVLVAIVKLKDEKLVLGCADVRIIELADGSAWHIKGGGAFPEWVSLDG